MLRSVLRRLVRSRRVAAPAARRFMGGGGHGESFHGVHIHPPARWQSLYGEGAFILMWFWMMYRAKQDGAVLLGWVNPFDATPDAEVAARHGADDGHHGH